MIKPSIDLDKLKHEIIKPDIDINNMTQQELHAYSKGAYDISYTHGVEVANKIRELMYGEN